MTSTFTGDSGRYLTNDGLAPGNYFVKVSASGGRITALHKVQTAPPHQVNCPSCSPLTGSGVAVTAGTTTTGIDFALAAGGVITGTAVDAASGIGLNNVSVGIFDANNGLVSTAIDYAKFLQMYLDGGRYRGGRIISTDSVKKATTPIIKVATCPPAAAPCNTLTPFRAWSVYWLFAPRLLFDDLITSRP